MIQQPLWLECSDSDVRAAAAEVWQRLPLDARQRLAAIKLYSVRDLRASNGRRVLGLAVPGAIKIDPTGHPTQRTLVESCAHEYAHHYCQHLTPEARTRSDGDMEREVVAQLHRWGFGSEVQTSAVWGSDPRLAQR